MVKDAVRTSARLVALALLLLHAASAVTAQEFSRRQELAVFRLSYYGQPPVSPPVGLRVEVRGPRGSVTVELRGTGNPQNDSLFVRAFGAVDSRIRDVFVNLGRFTVIGMAQRLSAATVGDFIALLDEYRSQAAGLPEAVLLGQEAFTEADFRRLAGGFVVVIPSVTWYSLEPIDGGHRATIETSFTFVNVATTETFAQFQIRSTGADRQAERAVRDAVDGIAPELSFRIRSLPEFRISTGVIDVDGRDVILEFGRNMGLQPGEEYAIVADRAIAGGYVVSTETGLLVVREVHEQHSVGRVLYATPRVRPGDQLREVPRRGFDLGPYYEVLTDGLGITSVLGLRAAASRGFYDWRPWAAFELPLRGVLFGRYLPVNVSVGGEWNAHLGRFRLTPAAAIGVGGAVPIGDAADDRFRVSHVGASVRVSGSLLVTRDMLVSATIGAGYWASLYGGADPVVRETLSSYGGLIIGIGVIFK